MRDLPDPSYVVVAFAAVIVIGNGHPAVLARRIDERGERCEHIDRSIIYRLMQSVVHMDVLVGDSACNC